MKKPFASLLATLVLTTLFVLPAESAPAHPKSPVKPVSKQAAIKPAAEKPMPQKGIVDPSYEETDPLGLLQDSEGWVGKKISFEGLFVSFSPYALDYKGAMRSSKDYIAFLIRRPDVAHHIIPLSELKLILPRPKTDKNSVIDLENGDQVLVKGKVFSAALGDPWVDVDDVVLLKKNPENVVKDKDKNKKHELE